MTVLCDHLHKSGYPLRIGVACDQFQFAWPLHKLSLSTGYLTAGAPIYAPYGVKFNVHSPVSIVFDKKTPIVSHWRNLMIETESYWRTDKTFKLIAEGIEIFPISSSFKDKKFQDKPELQVKNKKTVQENVGAQASLKGAPDVIVPVLDQEDMPQKITAEFLRLDLKHEKIIYRGISLLMILILLCFLLLILWKCPKLMAIWNGFSMKCLICLKMKEIVGNNIFMEKVDF